MPSTTKQAESSPPHGLSPGNGDTKAQAILWAAFPSLPDFPLPAEIIEQVEELPGMLPTTLDEFAAILKMERDGSAQVNPPLTPTPPPPTPTE